MPYFDQRIKKWRGVIKTLGRRETKLFSTKTQAKTWEIEQREQRKNIARQQTETDMDLLSAANLYLDFCKLRFSTKTYKEKKALSEVLLNKWGSIPVTNITPSMVIHHLEQRANKVSKNSWNRDRKNLLAMFNWLQKVQSINHNPVVNIGKLPEQRKPEYIPPGDDIDKVLLLTQGQDRVMLTCYFYTFARRGELYDWVWDDINFEKEWYRLWTRKRLNSDREADYVTMPKDSELYKALWWQWQNRDKKSPYVFTNPRTGKRFVDRRKWLQELCKKAEVKPFGFKAFRKYGPSVLNDVHKVSMKKLQRLLRHKKQSTTEIYLKKIDDDLAGAVRLLEKKDTQGDTQTA